MMPNQRELVLQYAQDTYGTTADFPFADDWETAILRHGGNRKWYAILMRISGEKIGLTDGRIYDIMNVKCDPLMMGSLLQTPGVLPAYHMNKTHWVTVLLDGTATAETMYTLLQMSYHLTAPKRKNRRTTKQ